MSTERSPIELVRVLLSNLDRLHTGLCALAGDLRGGNLLSVSEFMILWETLHANMPPNVIFGGYWFPPCEVEPREKYLKQLIEKLKEKEEFTQKNIQDTLNIDKENW